MIITGVNNAVVSIVIEINDLYSIAGTLRSVEDFGSGDDMVIASHFALTVKRMKDELEAFKKNQVAEKVFATIDTETAAKN